MDTFPLPEMLNMDTVGTTADALKQSPMFASGMVMLDGSKVGLATTAGVQMLLSTAKLAEQSGGLFLLISPQAPLSQAFKDLGLESWLKQREAA